MVIHTLPGLANAAGSALDAMNMSVVLGTLAGDDTVIAIMRDSNAAAAFCGENKNEMTRYDYELLCARHGEKWVKKMFPRSVENLRQHLSRNAGN